MAFLAPHGAIGAQPADADLTQQARCRDSYRQLALSPPLTGISDAVEGYPWRLLYGYCFAQKGRLTIHQDWVLSAFDATRQEDAPGGRGVSFGSDLSIQWRQRSAPESTPYYELGSGLQYAAGTPFPAHGSHWTFTINAGVGVLVPLPAGRQLNTAFRYLHMSNAGLLRNNAGYDAFHLLIGIRW